MDNRKKILYLVTQSDTGGAQQYVYGLATRFSAAYDIVVASGEQAGGGALGARLQTAGIRHVYLSHLKRAIHPWHDLLALRQIIALIKTERPDIVHLNSTKISVLGSLATWVCKRTTYNLRLTTVFTVHGWVFDEQLSPRDADYYLHLKPFSVFIERLFARFKDALICLSAKDKATALRHRIAPAEKMTVIYNGREPLTFLDRTTARKKLNLDESDFVIGTISNLYPTKGLIHLLEAFALTEKQYSISQSEICNVKSAMKLVIIGDGPQRVELERIAAGFDIARQVTFAGSLPQAATLVAAFDIYAISSTKEGLPFALIEAMQAGLPIVTTAVGAIPEAITDGADGLLVEPGNGSALAAALLRLQADEVLRQRLGAAAQMAARERFTAERMVEETEAMYVRLLGHT